MMTWNNDFTRWARERAYEERLKQAGERRNLWKGVFIGSLLASLIWVPLTVALFKL